jgi:DedD protein
METRVKERLIGAVILVAMIVALVPEILSGPHKSTDVAASAASEPPTRTYTVNLEQPDLPAEDAPAESSQPPLQAAAPELSASTSEGQGEPEDTPAPDAATPSTESVPETPARSEPPEPPARERKPSSGWAVQLGSFSNGENAERLARELRGRGYKAFVSPYESAGQKRMRVRVGPEEERARAEQLAQRLRREGRQATVVSQP